MSKAAKAWKAGFGSGGWAARLPRYHWLHVPHFTFIPTGDSSELSDDVRQLFEELATALPADRRVQSGECHPSLDVRETEEAFEILIDVVGVRPDAIRVLFRENVVVIAGEKPPARPAVARTFHLVEREFGRFARAVRLSGAFDVQRGRAVLADGELRVSLPKMTDRRGRALRIPVTVAEGAR